MTEQHNTGPTMKNIDPKKVLQRVIMPRDSDPLDVRPLYVDEPANVHCHVTSRRGVTIPADSKVSFASYLNAFPASYWKRWTRIDEVTLKLSVRGNGRIDIYRSKVGGDSAHIDGIVVRSPKAWQAVEFTVSLSPFEDGGWIWFDVFTNESSLEIEEAAWTTTQVIPRKTLAVGITTIRPKDCVGALRALGEDPDVLEVVEKVFVADQGSQKVRETEGFSDAAKLLGDKLEIFEQGNLGGSGGFARVMYQAMLNSSVDQIMLMDDDIVLEPDALLRANTFARVTTQPIIVGSQMLNLLARSRLYTMGEVIDFKKFMWRPAPGALTDHDFSKYSLRESKQMHSRINVTYNGWWMCLIPREVVEHIGLPLPLFIKWDDGEYGLRAGNRGYATVTLPGSAVWHMPWTDKDDVLDWQAYFHVRNRLIVASLHGRYDLRAMNVQQLVKRSLRYLFSMSYSTVALEQKAIEDFLDGPDKLFEVLGTALPEVREIRKQYTDAQFLKSARELPAPTFDSVRAERMLQPPVGIPRIAARASQALLHNLMSPQASAQQRPQINVPATSALWFLLGNLDSATVSSADGTSVAFRRRDPKIFRELAARVAHNATRLAQEWPQISQAYRDALPELTSMESWAKVFEEK